MSTIAKRTRKPSSLRYYQDGPPEHVDLGQWALHVTGLGITSGSFGYEQLQQLLIDLIDNEGTM